MHQQGGLANIENNTSDKHSERVQSIKHRYPLVRLSLTDVWWCTC